MSISVCRKLSNPWHSFLRCPTVILYMGNSKFNPAPPIIASDHTQQAQVDEYKAIQTSKLILTCFSAMTGSLPAAIRSKILRLLLLHWRPKDIAEEVHCHFDIVYRIQKNLFMYDSSFRSQFRLKEASRKMHKTAENDLIVYLEEQSWIMQKEIIWYIWEKWGINVHQFTISRILKRRRWSNKKGQRVSIRQNDELRLNWIADLLRLTAEQLVFVDETLFNETTRWRHQAYASVGESARYQASRAREHCWSVLSTYTIDDYLLCTDIREGWFNGETFFRWLADELLPLCSFFPAPKSVIIINNVSIHCNARIEKLIISHECEIRYLSSYSSNFNFIELSFSVLKIWIRRHFEKIWPYFKDTFGEFLHYAVARSRCDRFSRQHFKHSVEYYIFETNIKALKRDLEANTIDFD